MQIALPNGLFAHGRVLRDACVAFYRARSREPGRPPIGSRDYEFVVGVYDDALKRWPVVGTDPSLDPEDEWPPPQVIRDPMTQSVEIYHHGNVRAATEREVVGLEQAAVWEHDEIVERLVGPTPRN